MRAVEEAELERVGRLVGEAASVADAVENAVAGAGAVEVRSVEHRLVW